MFQVRSAAVAAVQALGRESRFFSALSAHDSLDLVQAHLIVAPVVEDRCPLPEHADMGSLGPSLDHPEYIGLPHARIRKLPHSADRPGQLPLLSGGTSYPGSVEYYGVSCMAMPCTCFRWPCTTGTAAAAAALRDGFSPPLA